MSDLKTITIHGEAFEVPAPYQAGHTVSEIEASVLNQVRAENIANNFRAKIRAALDSDDPGNAVGELRDEFTEYAAAYEFTAAGVRRAATPVDPVAKEAMKIARQIVVAKIKEDKGMTLKKYLESDPKHQELFDANVEKVAENAKVVALAKKRVKEAAEIASIELAE